MSSAYARIVVFLIFALFIASCGPATTATPISPTTALPAVTNTITVTSTPS